jgi:hypothetical protein
MCVAPPYGEESQNRTKLMTNEERLNNLLDKFWDNYPDREKSEELYLMAVMIADLWEEVTHRTPEERSGIASRWRDFANKIKGSK